MDRELFLDWGAREIFHNPQARLGLRLQGPLCQMDHGEKKAYYFPKRLVDENCDTARNSGKTAANSGNCYMAILFHLRALYLLDFPSSLKRFQALLQS